MTTPATASRYIDLLKPRYHLGHIMPPGGSGLRRGRNYELYHLVPLDVMESSVGLGIKDYTVEGVEEAMGNFWNCVNTLAAEKVDVIILSGVPISSQLGRARVRSLLNEVEDKTGIEAISCLEAIIDGLQHLGAEKITIGSRWADQLNQAMTRYLEEAGIHVLRCTGRGQWAGEAFGMSFEEGLEMALDVAREAAAADPEADAVLLPGGAAMSIHAIPAVEDEFGKPALTNLTAHVSKHLVRPGIIPPIQGWGKLLATP
jgi:maleate cis-trans isomerase